MILSIQSWVCFGHVGNAAALFPLNRLGREVVAINTVQFSNHTGYGDWTGTVATGAEIRALIQGVAARGALARCEAVLSGYIGDPAIGDAVLAAVAEVRTDNPDALYCCDPVLGDEGRGVYVRPGIPEFFRDRALPQADIATPNLFELRHLTGLPVTTRAELFVAAETLRQTMRPGARILVTSVHTTETPEATIEVLAAGPDGAWLVSTPKLDLSVNGAGDVIAALFLHHCLTRPLPEALSRAASSVHQILAATEAAGSRELLTIAAQDAWVDAPPLVPSRPRESP